MAVRFVLEVELRPGAERDLVDAYRALVERVRLRDGLISHQLCRSLDDPTRWIVTSEWESLEASAAWDRSAEHAELIGPMRSCFASATATRYEVSADAGGGT